MIQRVVSVAVPSSEDSLFTNLETTPDDWGGSSLGEPLDDDGGAQGLSLFAEDDTSPQITDSSSDPFDIAALSPDGPSPDTAGLFSTDIAEVVKDPSFDFSPLNPETGAPSMGLGMPILPPKVDHSFCPESQLPMLLCCPVQEPYHSFLGEWMQNCYAADDKGFEFVNKDYTCLCCSFLFVKVGVGIC